MGQGIFGYVQQLEMLAFFSGYPLVYSIIRFIAPHFPLKNLRGKSMVSVLPYSYALSGSLYLGLQLKNLGPDYSLDKLGSQINQPWLFVWALLSLLFWIPSLYKRQLLSILHSLVFFFTIVKDIFFQFLGYKSNMPNFTNDIKIYTVSIALNTATFLFLFLLSSISVPRK